MLNNNQVDNGKVPITPRLSYYQNFPLWITILHFPNTEYLSQDRISTSRFRLLHFFSSLSLDILLYRTVLTYQSHQRAFLPSFFKSNNRTRHPTTRDLVLVSRILVMNDICINVYQHHVITTEISEGSWIENREFMYDLKCICYKSIYYRASRIICKRWILIVSLYL